MATSYLSVPPLKGAPVQIYTQHTSLDLDRTRQKPIAASVHSGPELGADSAVTGKHPLRRLIVCCDGTWKTSDGGPIDVPSNVTRISHAINAVSEEGIDQIVYYQSGVGTAGTIIGKVLGGISGMGLTEHIREAYTFLANNYHPGDEIILLGFSRGAFTARSIAGLVCQLGILTKRGMDDFYQAFERYVNLNAAKPKIDVKYVDSLVKHGKVWAHVKVKAIGVWDTVGSLGIPELPILKWLPVMRYNRKYAFLDTDIHPGIENAFHALALDERRATFAPALWHIKKGGEQDTNLKQCWFPGSHSNIGGGYPEQGLADITLAWMMQQLSPFIDFDEQYARSLYSETPEKALTDIIRVRSGWALGPINDSISGIFRLAGVTNRTPGNYYPSGLTNEYIHASVRVRLGLMGPGTAAAKPWRCPALKNWRLVGVDVDGYGIADIASLKPSMASTTSSTSAIRWEYTDPKPRKKGGQQNKQTSPVTGAVVDVEKSLLEDLLAGKELEVAGREYLEKILKIKPKGKAGDAGMGSAAK